MSWLSNRTSRRGLRLLVCLVVAGLVTILDQATKAVVRQDFALGQGMPLIPGVLELRYIENTGAAFSVGSGASLVFILIAAAVVLAIAWWVWREDLPFYIVCLLALVMGGGLGNMIDRLAKGSVTDFLATTFIDFPIFNVADIFVTVGVILSFIAYVGWDARRQSAASAERERHGKECAEAREAKRLRDEAEADAAAAADAADAPDASGVALEEAFDTDGLEGLEQDEDGADGR